MPTSPTTSADRLPRALAWTGALLTCASVVVPVAATRVTGAVSVWGVQPPLALGAAGLAVLAVALGESGRGRWAWLPALGAGGAVVRALGEVNPGTSWAGPVLGDGRIGVRRAVASLL